MKAILYADGGVVKSNPSEQGYISFKIVDEKGKELVAVAKKMSISDEYTNNMTEYTALIHGLSECLAIGVTHVTVVMDSQLIIRQVKGEYKVKNELLRRYHKLAIGMVSQFVSVELVWVKREHPDIDDIDTRGKRYIGSL